LAVTTQTFRLQVAEEFLRGRNASDLTSADVTHCVSAYAGKPLSLPGWLTALRSLLRFLLLAGDNASPLVHAVPSVPRWRQTSLPQHLEHSEIAVVLATCDRRTTIGRRDYAALLLMVRLGLRAGEVAALTLDDIDWELGEFVVHGKGRTTGRLPLPVDVGEALVAQLRRRRRETNSRAVFLQSRAPYRASTSATIGALATKALRAAGIMRGGAHRLRHTAATQMLRRGASLTEIAQVLRHRHIDTTAIYAKVDHVQLRKLAQPWPDNVLGRDRLRALAQRWPRGAA
jgi:integrase